MLAAVVALAVGAAACTRITESTPPPKTLVGTLAVLRVDVLIAESFPAQVTLRVTGTIPDVCTEIDEVTQSRDGETFTVSITTVRPPVACILVLPDPVVVSVPLGALVPGDYRAVVNGFAVGFRV